MKARMLFPVLIFALTFVRPCYCEIIHVKRDAVGLNDGSSWSNAFNDLQSAIDCSAAEDEIWVAAGPYVPSNQISPFSMKSNTMLYGGFKGTETNRVDRNWVDYPAILSGDILGDDVGFSNNTENVSTVLSATNNNVIDGFIIQSGHASDAGNEPSGGGLSIGGTARILNCVFSNNYAVALGGGINPSFPVRS
jgi:hypothetical protein